MVLWLVLAVLTAVVLIAVLRPLLRPGHDLPSASEPDVAVYRDQLAEVDADRARGLIGDNEAAAAKAEIARRLIATADAGANSSRSASPASPPMSAAVRYATIGLAALVPLLAIALYLRLGAPDLPSQPLAARLAAPPDAAHLPELIARVEARLRAHPEDGNGWDVIAPVYLKQGRYRDAADAYATAGRLLGQSTRRLAGFAEATVLANDGIVTEPAREAYKQLAEMEPKRPEPRFWLAMADEQGGRYAEAVAAYEALLKEAADDEPWRAVVSERLDAARAKLAPADKSAPAKAKSAPPRSGPSADDIAAAQSLTPEARAQLIDGMVSGLAARLKTDGSDLAGWQRLIRAYVVLGRGDDAATALADARRNFTSDPESLGQLDALAKSLGLGS